MIAALVAGFFVLAIVLGAVMYVTRTTFKIDIGPTPTERTARLDAAQAKSTLETEAAEKEIHNASLQDNIDRARDIAGRGKLR